jgi:hypothetical protein
MIFFLRSAIFQALIMVWNNSDHLCLSSGSFYLGFGAFRKSIRFNAEFLCKLATAQDFNAVQCLFEDAFLKKRINGNCFTVIITFFECGKVYDCHLGSENVIESALGNASLKGHLSAFETGSLASACTGKLTLVTFTGGFALTRCGAAAYTLTGLYGTRCG